MIDLHMGNVREIGPELKKLIKDRGWKQYDAARAVGVNQTQISEWTRGSAVPTVQLLTKLDAVFPGLLFRWRGDVQAYHAAKKKEAARTRKETIERRKNEAKTVDKPRESKRGKRSVKDASIGEICARAREAGMTYGEYVAKYCVGG